MKILHKFCIGLCILISLTIDSSESVPLDDYVYAQDPHFGWTLIQTYDEIDYKLYILNFTSQKWLDESYSSRPIWWHYLCITVPKQLTRPDKAFLFIDAGNNNDSVPKPHDVFLSLTSNLAVGIGSITADLQDVPNGPLIYTDDPTNRSRIEDASLGWTWRSFIANASNTYVPLNLPMTKASYRAMDAIQQFTEQYNITTPKKFVVAGASKRGWTTWLTAAVDTERVVAAIPIFMDILSFQANLHHMYRSLVGWTYALHEYYAANITLNVDNVNMTKLSAIIDPLNYISRFSKTKILQIQATGDEFFLPDNEDTFWKDLQIATGGSFLRRILNADHSCSGHLISLFLTMGSFYMSVYDDRSLPKLQWIKSSNSTHGYIRATVDISVGPKPISALGYHARTFGSERRDFRLYIGNPNDPTKPIANPVFWLSTGLVPEAETSTTIVYSLTFENPKSGWEGFLIQVSFPGPDGTALELTTETQIIPDTYPTGDCHGEQCLGTLV